jgi:CDGSH-type Zn-finger protein
MSEKPQIPSKSPCVETVKPGTYYWCSCGKSSKQPFCDGAHKGSSFQPMKIEITEEKKVAWCNCKYSEKKPFCDGAHKKLP